MRMPDRLLLQLVRLALGGVIAGAASLGHAADTPWPTPLADAARQAGIPPDAVSFWVQPVQGGPDRLSIHAAQPRSVASVMKLFTTGAALTTLGPAYTWTTEVGLGGRLVRGGILRGPLYIRGNGDPALVLERLHLFMTRWRAAGLHTIHGDIVLDRQRFQIADHDPAAFDGKPLKPYNAGPDATLLNHRALVLRFRPDDIQSGQVRISMEPRLAGLDLVNHTQLVDRPICGDWRESLTLALNPKGAASARTRSRWQIEVKGPYPRSCQEKDWPLLWTGDDVDDYAERLITQTWKDLGGHLTGRVVSGLWPPEQPVWMRWTSPPLAQVVYDINKFSNNVMARQLFLTLGAEAGQGTLDEARSVVAQQVRAATQDAAGHSPCDDHSLILDNGSGLSRQARSSAECMGRWMQALWASPVMPEWLASLPVAGVDGTAKRLDSAPGLVHVKTGSLDGASAVAGIAEGRSGQRYAVVGIVNGAQAESARPLLNALLSWTVHDQSHSEASR
ncbi:MAG: D-alanyl-D-alanine carboxypeptidase/D-alanyl-D-alanine-endopeptidase [Burkholderiales bacterium]|nr:D-alanyl-D-alanine carboxypeptidase/D-alanyl-D-alanine-endopeptidase [Burkholderiales bacterium]MDE2433969.1 D-alanyl-D-alanine carboxypeptidase/D-alanyl-D-alanine-endopeptidase [Burkholderiales bacterium]